MRIPLNVLLYALSPKADYKAQNINFGAKFLGFKIFDPDGLNEDMDPKFIYMIPKAAFQDIKQWKDVCFPGITFMCLKNEGNLLLDDFHPHQSLVILDSPRSFAYIVNKIINIFTSMDYWDKAVGTAMINGRSMQEILDITKEFIPYTVVVLDRSFSLLGYLEGQDKDIPSVNSILENGYVTPENMEKLRRRGLMSTSRDVSNPMISYYNADSGKKYYSMTYRFYQNDSIVGYLIVFRCEVHPKTNFLYVMNMIVDNLSIFFRTGNYKRLATSEAYENIFQELLDCEEPKRKIFEDKFSYVRGLPMDGKFLLAQMEYEDEDEVPRSFICWNLKTSFPNVKPFIYRKTLYALRILPEESEQSTFFTLEEENIFRKALRDHSYTLGVSQIFFSLMDLKRAVWQCGEALSFHRDTQIGECYFQSIMMRSFLSQPDVQKNLYNYWSPDYEILKQYDQEHATDFCDIYMKYLENGCNINQTASATFLHRNTVLNKVKKAMSIMPKGNDNHQRTICFAANYIYDHVKTH